MIVAMLGMRVVEMSLDKVVDVIPVRDLFMSAIRAVAMVRLVSRARMTAGTRVRIRGIRRVRMLVDMPLVFMMKVPVVKIIRMPLVLQRSVSAAFSVRVLVGVVNFVLGHKIAP